MHLFSRRRDLGDVMPSLREALQKALNSASSEGLLCWRTERIPLPASSTSGSMMNFADRSFATIPETCKRKMMKFLEKNEGFPDLKSV